MICEGGHELGHERRGSCDVPIVHRNRVRAVSRLLSLLGMAALAAGCGHGNPRASERSGPEIGRDTKLTSGATTADPATPGAPASPRGSHDLLEPLATDSGAPVERIDIGDGQHAYAALPIGARDKRALIVGVHGAGDRPDWSCTEWQAVTAGWAIVVCPVGVQHPSDKTAYVWGSADAIAARADKAVRAVRARYGAWVDDGPLVYGGWSQGGALASQVIAARPGMFDRAVLVEVGHTPLDANQVAAGLVAGGVRRAVVSCSSWKCRSFASAFEGAAKRRSLPVRVNDVGLRGHWFDEPVFRTLGPAFVWMVEDERRYAGLGAAVDARYSTD